VTLRCCVCLLCFTCAKQEIAHFQPYLYVRTTAHTAPASAVLDLSYPSIMKGTDTAWFGRSEKGKFEEQCEDVKLAVSCRTGCHPIPSSPLNLLGWLGSPQLQLMSKLPSSAVEDG